MRERPGLALRQALFEVTVLHCVDLLPADDGVRLPGDPEITVPYDVLTSALGPIEAGDDAAPRRLAAWLKQVRWIADSPDWLLAEQVQVIGLPVGHVLHPGLDWPLERIPGGALDLGLGVLGLDRTDPDGVPVVPASVWAAAGRDPKGAGWWDMARGRLEDCGTLAVERWRRRPDRVLTPLGRTDAVTLLGSTAFRKALAEGHEGLCAVALPMRSRGWLDLSAIDPAFAPAAARATAPEQRGFERTLLVTADEVALAREEAFPPLS